jgi:hypothetical protein
MAGAIIGVICGVMELYLLARVVHSVSGSGAAGSVLLLVLAKVALLILAFAAVILFFREDILYCGIGISGVLVIGSVVIFARNNAKLTKQEQNVKQTQENDKGGNVDHE